MDANALPIWRAPARHGGVWGEGAVVVAVAPFGWTRWRWTSRWTSRWTRWRWTSRSARFRWRSRAATAVVAPVVAAPLKKSRVGESVARVASAQASLAGASCSCTRSARPGRRTRRTPREAGRRRHARRRAPPAANDILLEVIGGETAGLTPRRRRRARWRTRPRPWRWTRPRPRSAGRDGGGGAAAPPNPPPNPIGGGPAALKFPMQGRVAGLAVALGHNHTARLGRRMADRPRTDRPSGERRVHRRAAAEPVPVAVRTVVRPRLIRDGRFVPVAVARGRGSPVTGPGTGPAWGLALRLRALGSVRARRRCWCPRGGDGAEVGDGDAVDSPCACSRTAWMERSAAPAPRRRCRGAWGGEFRVGRGGGAHTRGGGDGLRRRGSAREEGGGAGRERKIVSFAEERVAGAFRVGIAGVGIGARRRGAPARGRGCGPAGMSAAVVPPPHLGAAEGAAVGSVGGGWGRRRRRGAPVVQRLARRVRGGGGGGGARPPGAPPRAWDRRCGARGDPLYRSPWNPCRLGFRVRVRRWGRSARARVAGSPRWGKASVAPREERGAGIAARARAWPTVALAVALIPACLCVRRVPTGGRAP